MKALVVGGGIGGLAAALALLRRGIEVEVFEQAPELREVGAGIQLSPNGCRALHALGVLEPLQALACPTEEKEIRLWSTGRTWKLFSDSAAAVRRYGFPYLTIFRPDLLRVLAEAVRRLKPDAIQLNARAAGLTQDELAVTLELADGRQVAGDLLIGADGLHSCVRSALFGADEIVQTGMVAWRGLVPMEKVPPQLVRRVATNWSGPSGHVVHYPVLGGSQMNLVAVREGVASDGPPWMRASDPLSCREAYAGWHPDVHALIDAAPSLSIWALCLRPRLSQWATGRCALLGDACHPTLPFLAQGAVFAFEDSVVLARCVADGAGDVTAALSRYEALRLPRAYRMVDGATENGARVHSPELSTEAGAEAYAARQWSTASIADRFDWIYGYDAVTAGAAPRVARKNTPL